ncbi:CRP-like cAMP-binding protein [Novosphingobium sp. PhB57]|uniref:Crp/Fnr family transcriptional regulator n=1 Tax=Novosphingobium sp. PhB57 TaxID=2485107 RepID=UPI0010503CE5|nr:Crp/Fnr family transcriptional regulator [Novosphingobium sp. PhB57]TCU51850.1 CRP-like cAMP-binding protein [Novosphingobium sp. PhB57]
MTMSAQYPRNSVLTRLAALAPLTASDERHINNAVAAGTVLPPRRDLIREGERITIARLLVDGWAFRTHLVQNGYRQIIGLVLPGELIGTCAHLNAVGVVTTTTLTEVVTCLVPMPDPTDEHSGLSQVYAMSVALEEAYLCRQITRLGRMSASERLADWLLEVHDRLLLAGNASHDEFELPLTQEMIADVLGLTSVHVNRTIQLLRKSGLVTLSARRVIILDRKEMERVVCYSPVKVVF